jgi:hypothetical protein
MIDPHSGASLPDDHRAGYVAIEHAHYHLGQIVVANKLLPIV